VTVDFDEVVAEQHIRLQREAADIERQRASAARKAAWSFIIAAGVLFYGMLIVLVLDILGI
jgi:hypothetical protein